MARLFLIPTTLSTNIDHNVLLPFQLAQIKHLRHFIVETAKVARQHLKHLGLTASLQELELYELNKHSQNLDPLIQPLKSGIDVGLLSDCGLPAIADPGSRIVRLAHQHNITVIPFIGPSSLMLALMSSGVNGQSFAFTGYLPIDSIKRSQKLSQLQELILINKQSQIIIEAPFRNNQLLQALLDQLTSTIILTLAIGLMGSSQQIISQPIQIWKKQQHLPDLHKREVVFVIGAAD